MNRQEKLQLIQTPPAWMYPFDLGDGLKTPLLDEELRSIHQTREEMILPVVDRIFPDGLGGMKALDIACNEGYFSHLLYQRGAMVTGIDIRKVNIERARIIRNLYGYDSKRLQFEVADLFDITGESETYDLTLFLGILYHIENPMGALRMLYRITKTLCVIETQLTRQHQPIESGWGTTGSSRELPASLAVFCEPDQEKSNLSSLGTLSFIPNEAAVILMLKSAGFSDIVRVPARPNHNPQYVQKDRGVFHALK